MGKVKKVSKATQERKEKMASVTKLAADGKEKFTFFFTTASPFSQFHPANFQVDGVQYNCAEQYMMHQKAVLFKDEEMAAQILKQSDPKAIKASGRKVKNFNDREWTSRCKEFVKKGNIAKFSQNEDMKKALFHTVGSTLVEASPRDRRWGIGLGKDNPKALSRATWRGSNWLGIVLTEVRDELMAKESSPSDDKNESEAGAK